MNYGMWGIIMAGGGASNMYAGIKLKNQSRMVVGICNLLLGMVAAAAFICNMF